VKVRENEGITKKKKASKQGEVMTIKQEKRMLEGTL
jgi:hypothetical protein